VLRTLRTVVYL